MTTIFSPYQLKNLTLKNRIVMAPMTRSRASNNIADELTALYYAQRATAGLIISEGTPISPEGQGYLFNPGIYSQAQIEGWRLTTQSVHALGGKIFAQLWHVGRVSHSSIQPNEQQPVSATSKTAVGAQAYAYNEAGEPEFIQASAPRPLSTIEVKRVVNDFAIAAQNAIDAGFDGVEIHAANGYLFEQFMNPLVNDRDDEYSAQSLANRIRFTLEVVDAVVQKIGAQRVGIRFSPYGQVFDMPAYEETLETYEALGLELAQRQLSYVHIMTQYQPTETQAEKEAVAARTTQLLHTMKAAIGDTTLILAGALNLKRAQDLINQGLIDLAAFGQPFISNPDLVHRLQNNLALTNPDRNTYYGGGAAGYIDYPPSL